MKSWVSSAFSDQLQGSKEVKRPRTRLGTNSQAVNPQTPLKPRCENANISYKNNEKCQVQLSEKYEPKTKAELVVHKNKIEQLNNVLVSIGEKPKGSIVLIEGPAGCGKYVS